MAEVFQSKHTAQEIEAILDSTKGVKEVVAKFGQDAETNELLYNGQKVAIQINTLKLTVQATGWEGTEAPYTNAITVEGSKDAKTVELVTPDPDEITVEQIGVYQQAQILNGKQTEGEDIVTLYAYGTKPEVDLPITIIVTK